MAGNPAVAHLPVSLTWSHVRERPPPLASMPAMWQAKHHLHPPYHSSHCDHAKGGWKKWSMGCAGQHGDWHAARPFAYEPDWYTRKVDYIREGNYKYRSWPWDQASHATTRKGDGIRTFTNETIRHEVLEPRNIGYTGTPQQFPYEVPPPKWGLYHPHNYEEPIRFNHFPPIRG
ncbi:uncharacterized protein LOC106167391 [Lingula anatina]|uniref:Uncharacterized protein LOC106167391 n=1 Tax=Lingula anatina TaxID=7574 RepID=A0A1S3IUM3_LINAN|nr:uncharacterized protein LOC106167391 [Lingula anatina]|eukprot:XP_013401631.1 uncharacterized protein LOC106167391 [Lingula anatina]